MVAERKLKFDDSDLSFVSPIDFVYRHIEKSEGLEAVANKKIGNLLNHLHPAPLSSKVVFSLDGKNHHISLEVKSGAKRYFCEANDSSMYHAVDLLSGKFGRIVRKAKAQSKPKSEKIVDFLVENEDEELVDQA